MSAFVLKPEQIKRGYLTAQDFSDYAGYPVAVAYLDEFPFWNELYEKGELSRPKQFIRSAAIHQWAKKSVKDNPSLGTWGESSQTATDTSTFAHIQYADRLKTDDNRSFLPLHECGEKYPVDAVKRPIGAAVFKFRLSGHDANYEFQCSNMTSMPVDRIIARSYDGFMPLADDIHEASHLRQQRICTSEYMSSFIPRYYRELGADFNMRESFRTAGVGQGTLSTYRHARYSNNIFTTAAYYIGPALDALEANKKIPNYWDVYIAAEELRYRVLMEAINEKCVSSGAYRASLVAVLPTGKQPTQLPRLLIHEIRDNSHQYHKWVEQEGRKNPEYFYTLLREVRDRGDFTHPLSREVADKTIEAAEYFGGKDLTHAPNVRQKVNPPSAKLLTATHG